MVSTTPERQTDGDCAVFAFAAQINSATRVRLATGEIVVSLVW